MMTPRGTAWRRARADAIFQYKAWRMAIDWTVALYGLVPALFFAGYQYHAWYQELPVWMEPVSFGTVRSVLYLFTVAGTVRYYVLEADQLFLVQREGWFRRMMGWGAGFSLAVHTLWTVLLGAALYPLLARAFGVTPTETAVLFVLVGLFKVYVMLGKQWLGMRFAGWMNIVVRALLFAPAGFVFGFLSGLPTKEPVWAWAAAAALALPLFFLLRARIRLRGAFYHDVRREQQEKMKIAGMLLSAGGYRAPKKAKLRRKKPLLFPGSGRLFRQRTPENVFAESLIKAAFRSGSKLNLLLYSTLAGTGAMAVSPAGVYRYAIFGAVGLLNVYLAKGLAKEGANEGFVRLFHWKDGVKFAAFQKACFGIALPACLILALVMGLLQLGPAQGWIMLPIGAALAWIGSMLFTLGGS